MERRFYTYPVIRSHKVRYGAHKPARERLPGVLYLEHNEMRHAFPPERVTLISLIASQAAIAVENALLYAEIRSTNLSLEAQVEERTLAELWTEMDLAKKIQTVLLPANGERGGYAISAVMNPADKVGGDYYDIIPSNEKIWVLIGDVSGHGVTAGLLMMMVQASVRTLLKNQDNLEPSELIERVNNSIFENFRKIGSNDYMTIQAFCLKGTKVTYAGLHQEVILYKSELQKVIKYDIIDGMWIGIEEEISNSQVNHTFEMTPNDILLLYTDGITEAYRDKQLFSVEGLMQAFEEEAQKGIDDPSIISDLMNRIKDHTVDDDISLMTVRRL
jgi:serine phosphatase RsbU (regulator of sigma subunit)